MANLTVTTEPALEGSPVVFYFELDAALQVPVYVYYDNSWFTGTATAGIDYAEMSGVIVFEPGETSKTLSIPTYADTEIEGDEFFTLEIDVSGADTLTPWITGEIIDANESKPTISYTGKRKWNLNGNVKLTALATDLDGLNDLRAVQFWLYNGQYWSEVIWTEALEPIDSVTGVGRGEIYHGLQAGTYEMAVFAYDQSWNVSVVDYFPVTVSNVVNTAPFELQATALADAGLSLIGSVRDADGWDDVETVRIWRNRAGNLTLIGDATLTPTIDPLVAQFSLTSTIDIAQGDTIVITAYDEDLEATLTISPSLQPPENQPPGVTIVASSASYLPTQNLSISGVITDPDTPNLDYELRIINGIGTVISQTTMKPTGAYTDNASLLGLQGAYTAQVIVDDGEYSAAASIAFTVQNVAPITTVQATLDYDTVNIYSAFSDANGLGEFGAEVWIDDGGDWILVPITINIDGITGSATGSIAGLPSYAVGTAYDVYVWAWDWENVAEDMDTIVIPNYTPVVTIDNVFLTSSYYSVLYDLTQFDLNGNTYDWGDATPYTTYLRTVGGEWTTVSDEIAGDGSNNVATGLTGLAPGSYELYVSSPDLLGAVGISNTISFTIAGQSNLAPTITTNGNQTTTPPTSVTINASFSDPEGQAITSSAQLINAQGAVVASIPNLTGNSRTITWDSLNKEGAYTSRITASDGTNTVTKDDTITFLNAAPFLQSFVFGVNDQMFVQADQNTGFAAAVATDYNGIQDIQTWTVEYKLQETWATAPDGLVGGVWAPAPNVQVSDFVLSSSWETSQMLPGGTYDFRARVSDEQFTSNYAIGSFTQQDYAPTITINPVVSGGNITVSGTFVDHNGFSQSGGEIWIEQAGNWRSLGYIDPSNQPGNTYNYSQTYALTGGSGNVHVYVWDWSNGAEASQAFVV